MAFLHDGVWSKTLTDIITNILGRIWISNLNESCLARFSGYDRDMKREVPDVSLLLLQRSSGGDEHRFAR